MENLLHYFGSRKYFLGAVKMKTFKRYITINKEGATGGVYTDKKPEFNRSSCYAFVYHETGVEIERGGGEDGEGSAGVTLSMSKGSSDGYYAASSTHDETDEIPFPIMKKS